MNLNLTLKTLSERGCPGRGRFGYPQQPHPKVSRSVYPRPLRQGQPRSISGFTLAEMMVAVAVGMVIMTVIALVAMTSARSFAAMGNYVDMDANSRNAIDHMTLEIRQAGNLIEFSPTRLKFTTLGSTNSYLIYNWDSSTRSLTEWTSGSQTNTLLTQCDQLAFSLCDSAFAATTNVLNSKGLSVNWKCSRTVLGRQTTEDMQQARIVFRNKPI